MKNNWKVLIWAPLLCLLLSQSCGSGDSGLSEEELHALKVAAEDVPAFSADSAYQYIAQQVAFGPRVPMTEGHARTRDWIIATLEGFGLQVQRQDFQAETHDGLTWDLTNIIAKHNPEAKKRILLAAHWDTRRVADKDSERMDEPIDGANDGGSGVGILMEIARVLSTAERQPEVGIDFIFFDGEDDGEPEGSRLRSNRVFWCLGSQHWAKNPHEPGYTAFYGILLDMVAARGARFYREGHSMQYAKNIVTKVWNHAHALGFSDYFILRDAPPITDDHLYVNQAGIPMIDIVEFSPDFGFGSYHHTHADNMDLIDKRTIRAVGETVLFTLYQE
ncbi:peptidase M28 [Nitritalea halalkaliphila LW7]|uniref:Peptidase M28 n=1 Tax=Nitritalea halalkaliphila LW7 TaxID=1189621 RepID=I5BY94_9BACT|nr:M28 family peptidase [Nitritalea halalkaliphila]EIM74546.1 peptidase M28 [Nitritalea halalkaliphila LW7]